jgi:hypothetical protein
MLFPKSNKGERNERTVDKMGLEEVHIEFFLLKPAGKGPVVRTRQR